MRQRGCRSVLPRLFPKELYQKFCSTLKRISERGPLRLSMPKQNGTFANMNEDRIDASDDLPRDEDDSVSSIAPDVLRCLDKCKFFGELDDHLCRADPSKSREDCRGDFGISEAILRSHGFSEEDLTDIFEVLRSRGGFCDCEVLYNAVGDNRLKGEYWRARAAGQEPPSAHRKTK